MSSEHTVTPEPLPERIGPYVVLQLLGSGGMGNVYLGRHAETSEFAAVKVLPPTLARQEGFRLRFSREIEALERLHNPHIVDLLGSGEDAGTYYYAMEYVAGETLAQRLSRDRRLPWREVIALAQQLCTALKSAHDAGVIHRDIKPSNVLLGNDGVVKLTDFGIAQLFAADKLTLTGGVVGTAEYMSPEQAQGQRATKRSDLYSLGALLYVMLTGRPPFTGQTSVDILQKQRFGQFDLPGRYVPDIPSWLDTVVAQLLEKDPERRLPDAYVLSKRLQEVVDKVERSSRNSSTTTLDMTPEFEAAEQPPSGPGQATLMRDLMRMEIAREQAGTPVQQLLNNTWVLLSLLVLLVAGVWWAANRRPSAAALFATGEKLMAEEPGAGWLQARDEYFQPLLATDAETWRGRVTPYLEEIAVYELERSLLSPRSNRRRSDPTEPERQLREARRLWEAGQWQPARDRLDAIATLTRDDPDAAVYHRLAVKWRDELTAQQAESADPGPTVRAALLRAAAASPEDRAALLRALVTLYGDDPRVAAEMAEARQQLSQRAAEPPP
jgi:serine/threonine-protein kinase